MLKVYFPPGFNSEYRAINATSTYSANDALNAIMPKLGLEKKQFYSLYKVFSNGEACAIPEKMYLTEVLWEAEEEIAVKNKENSSNNNNNLSYKIEFRKKVWLNPEEDELNLAAQYLTFAQAIPNLLNGYYEFDLDKTLELISLYHHFLHADSPLKDLSTLVKGYCQGGRDKFGKDFENKVQDAIKKMKTNNPNISKDDCVAKFIQIFQTSEYYGTSFFIVGQSFDSSLPTKSETKKILLCNRFGLMSLTASITEFLSEDEDLQLIITSQDTSTGNGTENIGTSTLEEGFNTFLFDDHIEGLEGARVLNSLSRGHHHTTTDSINGIRSKTSTNGDTPSEHEVGKEVIFKISGEDGLDGIVHTEIETTVNDDTNARNGESSVQTLDTISGQGLSVDINETVELALSTLLGRLVIISQTGTGIVQGIDKEQRRGTSSTTRGQISGKPDPVSILILLETEQLLEVILEGKVQGLGGEITDDVGQVSSPERDDTLLSSDTPGAIHDSLVGFSQTTALQHLILVLDQELDTLDRGSSSLGNGSGDTTHHEVNGKVDI